MSDNRTLVFHLDPDTIRECVGNRDLTDREADAIADRVEAIMEEYIGVVFDDMSVEA